MTLRMYSLYITIHIRLSIRIEGCQKKIYGVQIFSRIVDCDFSISSLYRPTTDRPSLSANLHLWVSEQFDHRVLGSFSEIFFVISIRDEQTLTRLTLTRTCSNWITNSCCCYSKQDYAASKPEQKELITSLHGDEDGKWESSAVKTTKLVILFH